MGERKNNRRILGARRERVRATGRKETRRLSAKEEKVRGRLTRGLCALCIPASSMSL